MKNIELIALITANANKTKRIRAYSGPWYTDASRLSNTITTQIGRVISLMATKMDEGFFCHSDESLLIYSYQTLLISHLQSYCSLNMLIKPITDIDNTANDVGRPLHLVINCITGEVMNHAKSMIMLELASLEEIQDLQLEPPISYDNYHNYSPLCSFVAIAHHDAMENLQEIFQGQWDNSTVLQDSIAFDSYTEARDFLSQCASPFKYVGEIAHPKESLSELKAQGLGKEIIKLIDPTNVRIEFTPIKATREKESSPEDESKRLIDIMLEDKGK